ncbi:MAG TPA: alpha/beta hydrolase [Tepidisphaeraceae bacterium]|jgi:acetyl esterase/lipase
MRLGLWSVVGLGVLLLIVASISGLAQQTPANEPASGANTVIRLWPGDAPGAQGTADADVPTLTLFLPEPATANRAAVVVCPGGGYHGLAAHEGKPVAEWLNTLGVTAFVLKYRLGPKYHHPFEMGDVNRAIRTVRARAAEWKLDPNCIGVLGFSAGGHLASTAVTHFDEGKSDADDPIERASSRPDFGVLIYPVITMTDPFTHHGSRTNLLGDSPSEELVELMSNEKQVTDKTPPCFLVHTATDTVVPFQNSLLFAEAMQKHHVPVELHVFDHGAHGFGLGGKDPILSQWPGLCAKWMQSHGWL